MNFMETVYISLDEDKKKLNSPKQIPPLGEPLSIGSQCYWFTPTAASRFCETRKILEHATPYHKDDTTKYSVSMLRFGRMHNSSQPSFETLKNLCGAQDVTCYATEEQPSVGSNQHMGSSL